MRAPPDSAVEAVALLRQVLDQQRLMRQAIDRIEALLHARIGSIGPRDDCDRLLLSAIAESTAGRAFSARELFHHARVDPALHEALHSADVDNPRQLGRLLRRLEGAALAEGLALARVGLDREGIIWKVSRV